MCFRCVALRVARLRPLGSRIGVHCPSKPPCAACEVMSACALRIDATHSSLDCYIGSILLALSSIRADRRGTYQPTPDGGRPSVPTLQPPPHAVRPRLCAGQFPASLRLFEPSTHAACPSWLLAQHPPTPRTPSTCTLDPKSIQHWLPFRLFSSRMQQESTNHKLHPQV